MVTFNNTSCSGLVLYKVDNSSKTTTIDIPYVESNNAEFGQQFTVADVQRTPAGWRENQNPQAPCSPSPNAPLHDLQSSKRNETHGTH